MKKLIKLLIIFLLLPCIAFAGITDMHKSVIARKRIAGGGEDLEIGYTTIGSSDASWSSEGGLYLDITVPAGGITVSDGYVYLDSGSGTSTIYMAIYNTSDTQQGTCSTESASIPMSPQWNHVTWAVPIALSAGNYRIQFYQDNSSSLTYYYDEPGGDQGGFEASPPNCNTAYSTLTTRKLTMSIANYEAH